MSILNGIKWVSALVAEKAAKAFDWIKDKAHEIGNFIITKLRELCGKFMKWASKTIQKLKEKLNIVVTGTAYLLERVKEGFRKVASHYSELPDDEWEKNTVVSTKAISLDEVPEKIREKAAKMDIGEMMNISDDVSNVANEFNSLELDL